jgi:hypothetical protein
MASGHCQLKNTPRLCEHKAHSTITTLHHSRETMKVREKMSRGKKGELR